MVLQQPVLDEPVAGTEPTPEEIATLSEKARAEYLLAAAPFEDGSRPSAAELRRTFNELKALDAPETGIADRIKAALETLYGGDSQAYQAAWETLRPQIATHSQAYWEDVIKNPAKLAALGIQMPA